MFYIPGGKRFVADFYKNHSIHLFFTVSLLSVLELLRRPISPCEAERLQQLAGHRFLILRRGSFKAEAAAIIDGLGEEGIMCGAGGAVRFADTSPGLFIPALLLGSLESLAWLYFNLLRNAPPAAAGAGAALDQPQSLRYADFLKQMQKDFDPAEHLALVRRTESASKATLILALEAARQGNILGVDSVSQSKTITLYRRPEGEFRELCRVIGVIQEWLSQSGTRLNDAL